MEVNDCDVTNSVEAQNTTATEKFKSDFVWTLQATWHLVRVRLEAEAEFDRSACKKKRLWEGVAERVTARLRAEGYAGVPARAYECDLKWRNMLATYRKNAARARRAGLSGVHWEFFGVMDRVLGRSRQETETRRKAESQNAELEKAITGKRYMPILPTPAPATSRPPQDVLRLYLELQERKLNMWVQQKALEERKIDAINNLARAISSLAQDANATAGNHANATAGNHANATAGNHCAATAGNHANATAGNHCAATAGNHANATAGNHANATAGNHANATAGNHANATAGNHANAADSLASPSPQH